MYDITILSSGVGLGVYVPAMLIKQQLEMHGVNVGIVILESLFSEQKRDQLKQSRDTYQRDFKLAQHALKMSKWTGSHLNKDQVDTIIKLWKQEKRRRFILLSGFWIEVIKSYIKILDRDADDVEVDCCMLDASIPPSWIRYEGELNRFNVFNFFSFEKKEIINQICVEDLKFTSWLERENYITIHGGGWCLGSFKEQISELDRASIKLNIFWPNRSEINCATKINHRHLFSQHDWSPWVTDEYGRQSFPPLVELLPTGRVKHLNCRKHHVALNIIMKGKAIISKPGGMTLLDSWLSRTPIIFLPPFGTHETDNARLWEFFGFGVSYDKWKRSGYSMALIENLQRNLSKSEQAPSDYVLGLINRI